MKTLNFLPDEKFKAAAMINNMKESRKNCKVEVIEERSTSSSHPGLKLLKDGKSKVRKEIRDQRLETCRDLS